VAPAAAVEVVPAAAVEAVVDVSTLPAASPAPEVAPAPAPEPAPATPEPTPEPAASAEPAASNPVLSAVRLLLKETRTGAFAGKLDRVAADLGKSSEELTAALLAAGLKAPDKTREKPVFVEQAGEIFWLNLNAKEELWLNAKASKFADKDDESEDGADGEKKSPRRSNGGSRPRRKE
jgi:hypothetical protein